MIRPKEFYPIGSVLGFNEFWDWLQFDSLEAEGFFERIRSLKYFPTAQENYVRAYYLDYLDHEIAEIFGAHIVAAEYIRDSSHQFNADKFIKDIIQPNECEDWEDAVTRKWQSQAKDGIRLLGIMGHYFR